MTFSEAECLEIMVNRRLWIKALRGEGSRKYRKHRGDLASSNYRSFCCLGVAAESIPALSMERTEDGRYKAPYANHISASLIVDQATLIGFSNSMLMFLIHLNDDRRVPLSVIGDVIEQMPIHQGKYHDYAPVTEWENTIPEIASILLSYQKVYS